MKFKKVSIMVLILISVLSITGCKKEDIQLSGNQTTESTTSEITMETTRLEKTILSKSDNEKWNNLTNEEKSKIVEVIVKDNKDSILTYLKTAKNKEEFHAYEARFFKRPENEIYDYQFGLSSTSSFVDDDTKNYKFQIYLVIEGEKYIVDNLEMVYDYDNIKQPVEETTEVVEETTEYIEEEVVAAEETGEYISSDKIKGTQMFFASRAGVYYGYSKGPEASMGGLITVINDLSSTTFELGQYETDNVGTVELSKIISKETLPNGYLKVVYETNIGNVVMEYKDINIVYYTEANSGYKTYLTFLWEVDSIDKIPEKIIEYDMTYNKMINDLFDTTVDFTNEINGVIKYTRDNVSQDIAYNKIKFVQGEYLEMDGYFKNYILDEKVVLKIFMSFKFDQIFLIDRELSEEYSWKYKNYLFNE